MNDGDATQNKAARAAWVATLGLCAALVAAPWRGHVDDMDAQFYLVIVRTMATAHQWFDLRCLPGFYPKFREHLPFGFWPAIAAIRLFGEWAVAPIYALFTLGAIVVSGRIARRLGGPWACVAAMVLLGTCEVIWQYGGRPLLEPPLFFFATAAAGAALEDRWIAAAVLGGVATLIKGPFGLLPLACVAAGRLPDKRASLAAVSAVVPLALFLLVDPADGWRTEFLRGQLLASASGGRTDGIVLWWFPLSVIARRFWPGFPFLLLGVWRAVRDARLRPLAIACVLMAALLCVPERKWGNHTYVAFPLLAALAGVAAGSLLGRVRPAAVAGALIACSLIAWVLSASGILTFVLRPPCAFSTVLGPSLDSLKPGDSLLVVAPKTNTLAIVELAAERRLSPWPASKLPTSVDIPVAVVEDGIEIPPAWTVIARGGGWSVVRARPAASY